MRNQISALMQLLLLALLILGTNSVGAKGMKGNLEANELSFMENTFIPILLKSHLCTRATGDCRGDHITCWSGDALSCDVYGISDEKVIKEIFLAMLNSDLNVSSFTFWKSRYHEGSWFEKPILRYENRSAGKSPH